MRTLGILVALLMIAATVLAGCLTIPEDEEGETPEPGPTLGPNETDDLTQPAAKNNRLYFHGTGPDDVWMSTNANESSTTLTATLTPASDDHVVEFPLTPSPGRSINMTGADATACLQLTMATVGMGPTHTTALLVDGAEVASTTASSQTVNGQLCMALEGIDRIPSGADVTLRLTVSPEPTTLNAQWEMDLDGRSYLTLPIETPVYVDLNATGDGGPSSSRRADGDVMTYQQNGRWYAEKTVTLTGGVGSADDLDVTLATGNGHIDATPRADSTYRAVLELAAHADTEEEARAKLDEIRVEHSDDISDGTMEWRTRASTPGNTWNNQSAHIEAEIPTQIELQDLSLDTGNGALDATDLTGATAGFDTGNGAIRLTGLTFDEATADSGNGQLSVDGGSYGALDLDTGNGQIEVEGARIGDLDASTGNGQIDVQGTPTGGAWSASTGNGQVEVVVPDTSQYGYDARGGTSPYTGTVTIDLADTEPVGEQEAHSKHERTTNYDERQVRTQIDVSTANGDVDIVGD